MAGKEASEGMMVTAVLDPASASIRGYTDMYMAKYKTAPNGFSPSFYDFTDMMFEAMRRAGTVSDTQKVRLELEKLKDYSGVLGQLNWTGKANYGVDHQLAVPFYVSEIKNGAEVVRARCTVADGCK